jgi:5-formyltetrahydrofolate cyclo-ligase
VKGKEELILNRFGIWEPNQTKCQVLKSFNSGERIIVPGAAFTINGGRLGYGGGYYDRFFSETQNSIPLKWGVCYSQQLVPSLPHTEQDCQMDRVITELNERDGSYGAAEPN